MIFVLGAVVVAVVVVGLLILSDRGRRSGEQVSVTPGWVSSACGSLGVVALATAMIGSWVGDFGDWMFPASITLGLVGLVAGGYAAARGDRSWRIWVGLITSGLVMAFWILFAVGEVVYPH
ncbi:MAG: hypothetical protein WAL91_08845 [Propionicimonas sp.]